MKIVTVVGARPQFIKAFPVSMQIRKEHEEVLIHTGQHYEHGMSALLFDELGIPEPHVNLEAGSGTHGKQTARILAGLEEHLLQSRPDIVIVYGDTNSTMAAALAASKLGIRVAHVEAGMRCGDMCMPEEVNRLVADRLSSILFCSTESAVRNLSAEGISSGVHLVGDVMVDAMEIALPLAEKKSAILKRLELKEGEYVFCTLHRASNTQRERLQRIVEALTRVEQVVAFPLHPRTRKMLRDYGLTVSLQERSHIRLTEPVSYMESLLLQSNAMVILTDSGGIQKEAYVLGKPCLTLREETEWTETVEAGWNLLVGTDPARILEGVRDFRPDCQRENLFGDGQASRRIASVLSGAAPSP